MHVKKWFVAGVLMCALVLAGCQQSNVSDAAAGQAQETQTEQETPTDQKTQEEQPKNTVLRLAGGDTGLPNPFRHHPRGPGMAKMQLLYDSLLEKNEEGLIPWLAADWKMSEDGKVITFSLVEGAVWHDGEPLTAEDVVFTYEYYQKHPPVSNSLMADGGYIIESVKAPDSKTVQMTVRQPSATHLANIGFMRILPKHIWETVEDPAAYEGEDAVVGSGPFVMDSYNPQQGTYRFLAFQDYWGANPRVAAIEWVPVSDAVLAFENNEISLINASTDVLARYENQPDFTIDSKHSFHNYRLMMNMERRSEFQAIELRQALAYAIDREGLIEKVERGSGAIGSMGYIPEANKWYNPNVKQYDYDIEKAKALIGEASHTFSLIIGNDPKEVRIAELMKIDLDQVGITLNIESVDSKSRDEAVQKENYELALINTGGLGGDPDYLRVTYADEQATGLASTIPGYANEAINRLATVQRTEMDEAKRKELIDQLQEMIAEEVPMILLYGAVDNHLYRPAEYDGWMYRYDHNKTDHNKLSYLERNDQ